MEETPPDSLSCLELKRQLQEKNDEIEKLKVLIEDFKQQERGSQQLEQALLSVKTKDHVFRDFNTVTSLPKSDIERYSRQLILPEFGVKGQLRLKSTSVLIVGAGGLGCPAAVYLAAAGIGRLGVIDYDEVELSNLHRQILHTSDRVGLSKSLSVARSCQRLNSSVEYIPYQLQLSSQNALDIVRRYDIVLDATDNVASRYLLNDACILAGKPLVSGSALRFEGQLTVYNCDGGPCYRCLFPQPPPPETVTNCSDGGVIGVVPGIVGSLQALEAIKIASGIGCSYSQRLLLFDALDGTFRSVKLRPRSRDCVVCGDQPSITHLVDYVQFCGAAASDKDQELSLLDAKSRITAKDYHKMMSDGVSHLLVDVRPSVEMDICQLPHPSLNIPITTLTKDVPKAAEQILQKLKDVQQQQHLLPQQQQRHADAPTIVCVCRRGNESQQAVRQLQTELQTHLERVGAAPQVVDIRGGLHAWARQVDDQFPVY